MAAGSARYVRYILIAFFAINAVYFMYHSKSGVASQGVDVMTGSGKEKSPLTQPPTENPTKKQTNTEQQLIKEPTKESVKESVKEPVKEKVKEKVKETTKEATPKPKSKPKLTSDKEHPMAMTPGEPEWEDLVSIAPGPRMNATFVTLARNSDVWDIARSIRQVEDRFNKRFNYDWVFLNDKPFDDTFKKVTTSLVSGKTHYGLIPTEHWSFPSHIDQEKAKKVREDMAARKIIYGDSISYRHMCRFESGFFFRQELMMNYDYYWRVEPSVELFCDIHYDPFRYMAENKKKYSFVLSLYEYVETIPTLWDSVKKFMKNHPEHIAEGNAMGFLSDDGGDNYNHCHFWSNFEVGDLNWLRSKAYIDYFTSLDQDGGFFYERWGDAPVHSIAAALLLKKEEIHFFNDIAYYHVPFTHCPTGEKLRTELRCHCNPKENFDWKGYSCTSRFFEVSGLEKPEGWENQQD